MVLILLFIMDVSELACIIIISLLGFVNIPVLFVSYELAVELTSESGLGEATPCGVINMLSNGLGFGVILGLTPILSGQSK